MSNDAIMLERAFLPSALLSSLIVDKDAHLWNVGYHQSNDYTDGQNFACPIVLKRGLTSLR